MIKIENERIAGSLDAMRGMRNPMNSWDKNDSNDEQIGNNDLELARKLAALGPVHAKYRRMIIVWVDITAPLYWWKEFDTYKVGTVANSCSTMHTIHKRPFTIDDFSHEHLVSFRDYMNLDNVNIHPAINPEFKTERIHNYYIFPDEHLQLTIKLLNKCRELYLKTKDKAYWWQMIQLLPSSYNQRRTVMLNYEVLSHIYPDRKEHKLDEWREFCFWIENLPYSEIICGDLEDEK